MPTRHEARELAIQLLYQFDARGEGDAVDVAESLAESGKPEPTRALALELARGAWGVHEEADALVRELAPEWPTHRQPVVDRNILRLGYYELASGMTPRAVAINEAVELAKSFGSDRSPAFINGVLDQIANRLESPQPRTNTDG